MRLRRLDLTRYGRFTDRRLDFGRAEEGAPDFHVVYGLNEAGKSTTLSGFLDLLFGIEERSRYGFLHDYRTMEVGGVLEWNGGAHELVRRKQRAGSLTDPSGRVLDDGLVAGALSGLGRDAYRTMFSLDDETLEAGGDAILQSRGDLGEMLFSASSGLGRLGAHLAKLSEEADAIRKGRARSTELALLKARLQELKEKREAIDTAAAAYKTLTETLEAARAGYEAAMEERRGVAAHLDRAERAARALPLGAEFERLAALLAESQDLPRPPPAWALELPDLLQAETRLAALGGEAGETAARLEAEIAALHPDGALLGEAPAIRRLTERLGAIRAGARELPGHRAARGEKEAGLALLLAALGTPNEAEPARLLLTVAQEEPIAALAEARAALAERLEGAEAELADAEEAEARARTEWQALGADGEADLQRVAAALAQLRNSKAGASLAQAEREASGLSRRARDAVDALRPWRGTAGELRALDLPDARRIEAWRGAALAVERRLLAERDRAREAETRVRAERARLSHLRGEAGAIGDAEAHAAREARDAAWARHRASLDAATAAEFEERLLADDRLGAARLSRARDLAEMREAGLELARAEEAHVRAAALLTEAEAERDALAQEIADALPQIPGGAAGDPARLAERAEGFSRRREAALGLLDAEDDALDRAETARAEIEADRRRLEAALEAAGIDADGEADALRDLAEAAIQARGKAEFARQSGAKRLAEAEAALTLRRRRRDAAEGAFANWLAEWDAALGRTWIDTREVAAVRGLLARLRSLAALLAERDELSRRIEALEGERARFAAETGELAARLGTAAADGTKTPEETLDALTAGLDAALREADLRAAKAKDLAELTERRRGLAAEGARLDARRAEMTEFFGLASLAEVARAVERDAERGRTEARLAEIGDGLRREMRAASPQAAIEALAGLEAETVEAERGELSRRIADLDALGQTRFAERAAAEGALARVGGDDAVARIQAERQTVLVEMEDAAARWLRLKAGLLVAQGALAAFRENHRSTMMAKASAAFAAMTRGAYRGLSAQGGRERETLIGVARDGASKLAETMSKGTRFQLYLALRLAGYEEFAAARVPVPFVADDIMETFDEPRSEEVLRLLAGLARRGQVVYLTHHRHLCDLARAVEPQVRIHEL